METMPQATMARATARFKSPAPTGDQTLAKSKKSADLSKITKGQQGILSSTLSQPVHFKVSGGIKGKTLTSNHGGVSAVLESPGPSQGGPVKR